ncbi:MAG TPA: hypothetical protein PLZ79_07090 [Burkholderiales bacterium]|nr:hypothetical protein [Burkholderiales bacterium]
MVASERNTQPAAAALQPEAGSTMLVVGIHREERAFGELVAQGIEHAGVSVLRIPEGISGRHPRADQRFHYETLHRALYLQLLPYVLGHYRLLIDLHTGTDSLGPSADLISANGGFLDCLSKRATADDTVNQRKLRCLRLEEGSAPVTKTIIPERVWNNPAFVYLGMEIYLPETVQDLTAAAEFARRLVLIGARCVEAGPDCRGSVRLA